MARISADQYVALRTNQYNRVVASYAFVIFGMIAVTGIALAYGPAAALAGKLLIATAAVSVALYAGLAIPAIWAEASGLRQDKADGIAGSAYDKAIDGHNYGLYSALAVLAAVVFVVLTIWLLFF